ncbi:GAF domain-containing protein [Pseudochryseolinea flava]|uniref:histidine kinase n=1 Tax=Pseudochryseolinea flava TaxID=2059302 RepID=A0A364Y7B7_9BACT|nr:GAF domain-containing protein [Pseudochryseolinea flava]RAW02961.1 hypothetical protein DQQ10_02330 [Pseudochryseolinea flava]
MFPKDDKLQDEQSLMSIFRVYLIILIFVYLVGAVLEFLIDFQASSIVHFLALMAIPSLLLIASHTGLSYRVLFFCNMMFIFLGNGIQIYLNPQAFHVLVYWVALMPLLIAVLIQRVRETIFWSVLLVVFMIGMGLYADGATNGSYTVTLYPTRFIAGGFLFLLLTCSVATFFSYIQARKKKALILQNEELANLKREVELQRDKTNLKNGRLESYIKAIAELSQSQEVINGNFERAVQRMCQTLDYLLRVTQVSYWTYEDDANTITCRYTFPENRSRNTVHNLANFPRYATRLKMKTIIHTSNAAEDPNTAEFGKTYLAAQKIKSMMDAPIVINGNLVGILCCEDMEERHWNGEELLFASAACDVLTIAFKAMQNTIYISEIESKKSALEDQTEEINQMNEKLVQANETLEDRVASRTAELEAQNKQLSEYAFINSHLLRAPLSSILGLVNLLHNSDLSNREQELVRHLAESGKKLDEIIHRIGDTLAKNDSMTREDILTKNTLGDSGKR